MQSDLKYGEEKNRDICPPKYISNLVLYTYINIDKPFSVAYLKFLLHVLLCHPTTTVLETMTLVHLGVIAMFLSPHSLLSTLLV